MRYLNLSALLFRLPPAPYYVCRTGAIPVLGNRLARVIQTARILGKVTNSIIEGAGHISVFGDFEHFASCASNQTILTTIFVKRVQDGYFGGQMGDRMENSEPSLCSSESCMLPNFRFQD